MLILPSSPLTGWPASIDAYKDHANASVQGTGADCVRVCVCVCVCYRPREREREKDIRALPVIRETVGKALFAFNWEIPSTGLEEGEACGGDFWENIVLKGWRGGAMCVCAHSM